MDLTAILTPILSALGTALAGLLVALVTQWLRKMNVNLATEQQAQLLHVTKLGVQYAEEQAKNYFRQRNERLTGPEKQTMAVDFVRTHLPKANTEKVGQLIPAVLPEVRAESAVPVAFTVAEHGRQ
jgi:hypothetical protein